MMIIGTPHAKGAGYYRNDDSLAGGKKAEADVRTCTHCQKVILMNKWKDDGGFCSRCMAPICGFCADEMQTQGCVPFVKKIEEAANRHVKLEALRKLAGLDDPAAIPQLIIPERR